MITGSIKNVHCLQRNHEVEHIVVLALAGRCSVLDCRETRLAGRLVAVAKQVTGHSLAPTAISTIVDPAELNAFHRPKAVPMQACDGTSSGIEAIKGI